MFKIHYRQYRQCTNQKINIKRRNPPMRMNLRTVCCIPVLLTYILPPQVRCQFLMPARPYVGIVDRKASLASSVTCVPSWLDGTLSCAAVWRAHQ